MGRAPEAADGNRRTAATRQRRCAPGERGRRRVRLHAQGPPDHAHRLAVPRARAARPHAARSRRARSATPTRSPAGSSAATWCGCRAGSSASATSWWSRSPRSRAPSDADGGRPGALPADRLPRPRRARRLPRAPRRRGRTTAATARCSTRCSGDARAARRAAAGAVHARRATTPTSAACSSTPSRSRTLAHELCQLHPRLNSDLLLTAAIVHDLGRTREFTYGAEIGADRGGPAARPPGDRRADARRARGGARRASAGSRSCTACSATTARDRARAGASRSRRGARAVPAQRARRERQGRARARARESAVGAAASASISPARHGPGGPSGLQNWQGRATPGLEGSIPSPRRGWRSARLGLPRSETWLDSNSMVSLSYRSW